MKLVLSITRYYKVYKNREKQTKREHKSYCITSQVCTLPYNIGLIYRTQMNK